MTEMRQDVPVPIIRVSSLSPVLREIERRGISAAALLSRHALTRAQLSDRYVEIPLRRYLAFLEDTPGVTGDAAFCAGVGTSFRPADLGPVGLLFDASSTLRRGLERLAMSLISWQDQTAIRVQPEDGALVWSYQIDDPDLWPRRQDSEYSLAATLALAQAAFGPAARLLEAHLEHAEPDHATVLTRILGVRPQFGQSANRLIFDLAAAERVQRPEDEGLMAILTRHVADLRRPKADGDLLARVRRLIALHLGQRPVTLDLIAAELNLSTRTLQRRLTGLRTSLRDMLRDSRLHLARTHLREARLSNAEIARLLGYADSTAFWRAYKAGAGLPPSRDRGGARDPDA